MVFSSTQLFAKKYRCSLFDICHKDKGIKSTSTDRKIFVTQRFQKKYYHLNFEHISQKNQLDNRAHISNWAEMQNSSAIRIFLSVARTTRNENFTDKFPFLCLGKNIFLSLCCLLAYFYFFNS